MNCGRIIQTQRLKCFEVAENVFAAISPYRGTCWCNAGFIARGDGLIFDTFTDLHHARELREAYEQVSGGKPPKYVFNSHHNGDHTWGNKAFVDCATFIAHENCTNADSIEVWSGLAKTDPATAPDFLQDICRVMNGFDLTGVEWVEPDIMLRGDAKMRLGDTEIEFLYRGPAHTESDMMLWMPKEKVLFSGDIIFNGCAAWNGEGLRNWIKIHDYIIDELKPEVVIPGHGAICDLDFVREHQSYLISVVEQFDKYYDDDIDILSLAEKIDISDWLHWIEPQRLIVNLIALLKVRRPNGPEINAHYEMYRFKRILAEKYGDKIKPWDPMYCWNEN